MYSESVWRCVTACVEARGQLSGVTSFHQVYFGGHTGVIRLGNKCLYIWSHLVSLVVFILRRFTKATQLAVFLLQPLKWLGLLFMLTAIAWGYFLKFQSEGKMYSMCPLNASISLVCLLFLTRAIAKRLLSKPALAPFARVSVLFFFLSARADMENSQIASFPGSGSPSAHWIVCCCYCSHLSNLQAVAASLPLIHAFPAPINLLLLLTPLLPHLLYPGSSLRL